MVIKGHASVIFWTNSAWGPLKQKPSETKKNFKREI